jgi:hypothetical protein
MPADIVARIDAALDELRPTGARPARHRVAEVVRLDSRARRRRIAMAAAGVAAAAVFIAGGFATFRNSIGTNATNMPAAGGARQAPNEAGDAAAPPAFALDQAVRGSASGTNYDAAALGRLAANERQAMSSPLPSPLSLPSLATGGAKAMATQHLSDLVADPLRRLTDPTQLAACLSAIGASQPGLVVALDYARYLGNPALIVVIRQDGRSTVVAAGPQCGLGAADILATATA